MKALNSEEFWQFACHLYNEGDMQTRLLDYQNQQAKNVNLCLLMYYLDSLNLAISLTQLNKLEQSICEFEQHVLKPLRTTRAYLKANQSEIDEYKTLRKELLSAELKLEKQQQKILIDAVNKMNLAPSATPNNSARYLP
ncbi:TIGR02444 family protein [Pseudoalteromonas mariniglutinosa]|uniref:TIGR02444 family protein n=1 Tax=Pseudoalteromonas mariniglutinosa TaxID=206042 RepID=UPI00384DC7DF